MPRSIFSPGGVDLLGKNPMQTVAAERELGGAASAISLIIQGAVSLSLLSSPTLSTNGAIVTQSAVSTSVESSPSLTQHNALAVQNEVSATFTAVGTPQVFLCPLLGQSNMEGRATAANGVDRTTVDVDVSGVYQYPGQPGQAGYQTLTSDITPLIHYTGYTRTNNVLGPAEYAFRQMKTDNPSAVAIIAVPCAVGSTGLATAGGGTAWAGSMTPGAGGSLFENAVTQTVADYAKATTDFPGVPIELVSFFVQGEQDAGNNVTYATYYAALVNMINCFRGRLVAAGISSASNHKFVIGSMIPMLWDPTSVFADSRYIPVNQAHVMASVNLSNVYYSKGVPGNSGSPTGAGGDGLHYLPVANTRQQGLSLGAVLSDTVGPTVTNPATIPVEWGHKLYLALTCNDYHATYEIVAGLDGAQFALSDPYLSAGLTWVGDGTGPAPGNYQVKVRARDGSGNYGATKTLTFKVAVEVNPVDYFYSGELGAVCDLSDPFNATAMYISQTIDGLTPVTAVGQSVGYVKNLTGNGNYTATANDTTRPTLDIDSNGKYRLKFDKTKSQKLYGPLMVQVGVNYAFFACMGLQAVAQAAATNIWAMHNATNGGYAPTGGVTPFLVPILSGTATSGVSQTGRNDTSAGGSFPALSTGILDGSPKVLSSSRSSVGVDTLRDANTRPSDGGAGGTNFNSATNTSIGNAIHVERSAIGTSAAFATGAFYDGYVYSFAFINRDTTPVEQFAIEDWVGRRTLGTALPGQLINTPLTIADAYSLTTEQNVTLTPHGGSSALTVNPAVSITLASSPTLTPHLGLVINTLVSASQLSPVLFGSTVTTTVRIVSLGRPVANGNRVSFYNIK